MYHVFYYRVDDDGVSLYIDDEKDFSSFDESLKAVRFDDGELFEIARDEFCFDDSCDVTCLKTVARSIAMSEFVNSYYLRW